MFSLQLAEKVKSDLSSVELNPKEGGMAAFKVGCMKSHQEGGSLLRTRDCRFHSGVTLLFITEVSTKGWCEVDSLS